MGIDFLKRPPRVETNPSLESKGPFCRSQLQNRVAESRAIRAASFGWHE